MLLLLMLTRGRRVERAALVGSNGVGGGVGHIRRVELRQTASNSSWEWTCTRASGVLQLWQSVSVDIESTVPYFIAVSVEEQDSSQPAQQFCFGATCSWMRATNSASINLLVCQTEVAKVRDPDKRHSALEADVVSGNSRVWDVG